MDSVSVRVLRLSGMCVNHEQCTRDGGRSRHGRLYQYASVLSVWMAAYITSSAFLTLLQDSAVRMEEGGPTTGLVDSFICSFSLYTTWVYVSVWQTRPRATALHHLLVEHDAFMRKFEARVEMEGLAAHRRLLTIMYRWERLFALYMYGSLATVIALVTLQVLFIRTPAVPPFPRYVCAGPGGGGEPLQEDGGGGQDMGEFNSCVISFIVVQGLSMPCCALPFSSFSGVHFGLNIRAIYLLQCLKKSLATLDFTEYRAVDRIVRQHQHIMRLIRGNNEIFSDALMKRLAITYVMLGLTAFCLSTDPFADMKIPFIATFMIASLFQFAVLSDIVRDASSTVTEEVWRSAWFMRATRDDLFKMRMMTMRAQRSAWDGLQMAGTQDCVSMTTFVQVMKSSISYLQALRTIQMSS